MGTKLFIHGFNGRMGQTIHSLVNESESFSFVGGASSSALFKADLTNVEKSSESFNELVNACDVIVDFSNDLGNKSLFEYLKLHKTKSQKIVIGSTGLTNDALEAWKRLCKDKELSILIAPNTSLGVLLTMQLSKTMAKILNPAGFDIEITESHHKFKKDSPSGTATFLAESICKETDLKPVFERRLQRSDKDLGVFAIRGGSVFGEHTVHFMGQDEYLKITHQALSRDLFGKGALVLAQWLNSKKSGYYKLEDVSLDELI